VAVLLGFTASDIALVACRAGALASAAAALELAVEVLLAMELQTKEGWDLGCLHQALLSQFPLVRAACFSPWVAVGVPVLKVKPVVVEVEAPTGSSAACLPEVAVWVVKVVTSGAEGAAACRASVALASVASAA
jgi:hypothetical protein